MSEISDSECVWRELPAGAPLSGRVITVDQRRRIIARNMRNIENQGLAVPLHELHTVFAVESEAQR